TPPSSSQDNCRDEAQMLREQSPTVANDYSNRKFRGREKFHINFFFIWIRGRSSARPDGRLVKVIFKDAAAIII
ncbi:hypothetical protein, partial [Desulfobulbus alkaliphilus]|uniref:hypothetical protein n=1 Tax=Desulfobulbus alkaliphilus TaxID=869814 RepID=UPI00196626E3